MTAPRRAVFSIIGWLLFLLAATVAWYFLLSIAAPARVDFDGERGTLLGTFIPPLLLTLICWTGLRRLTAPAPAPAVAETSAAPPAPAEAPLPKARFRIGAWSVMTPQGDAAQTAELTKAREKAFKPDKAIVLENGNPAHAGMVPKLMLERAGYPANTRLRAPRVGTMLTGILDEIHARQISLQDMIEGPANVYWIVPRTLLTQDNAHANLFAAAWRRSAWRESAYLLHMVPSAPAAGYAIVSALQNGIDDSLIPYTLIVAADSLLDSNELELDEIFSATAPLGYIPSEGAAGFLLFHPEKSPQAMWADAPTLAPVATIELPAEQAAKAAANALSQAMASSLLAAAKPAADVKLVISDTDHRVQGSMDVIGALAQVMEHLDPLEDRRSPMEYAGSFGAATDIIHLALAMELAAADSLVVCTVCNAGGQVASVLVLPA
jgi:hypothetical protein